MSQQSRFDWVYYKKIIKNNKLFYLLSQIQLTFMCCGT